jgi:hypothetical protein
MRWVSGANATAAGIRALGMVQLADLHFDTGTLYVHDGFGTLVANGNTYSGLGNYGGIDAVGEDLSNIANPLTLTLSGVDAAYVSDVMTENVQGRMVTLYVGLFDVNAGSWYANPEISWEGRMDFPHIDIAQNQATIKVTCEHRLMREPLISRYTDQEQQIAHPNDNFFNLMWQIQLATASWGKVDISHPVNVLPGQNGGGGVIGGGGGGSGRPSPNKP